MIDASTKFPSGILYGSRYDFGNFDECLELKIPTDGQLLYGKHCMAKFTFNYKYQSVDGFPGSNYNLGNYQGSNITFWDRIDVSISHEQAHQFLVL